MRINKITSSLIALFVFAFSFIVSPAANAVTPAYSSKVALGANNAVWFLFTISEVPADITPDTNHSYNLSYPDCNNQGTLPACGSHTPNVRICTRDNSLTTSLTSCYYPNLATGYDGNLSNWHSGDISINTGAAYFDDNFVLQPTNGTYYASPVEASPSNVNCLSTPNQCTYWLEYYNANFTNGNQSGYTPLFGTGVVPTNYLQGLSWTPQGSNSNNNNNNNNSANCFTVADCKTFFVGLFNNSFVGQVKTIYDDFFRFQVTRANGEVVSWATVNPTVSNCDYGMIPNTTGQTHLPTGLQEGYNNANGLTPITGKCCIGAVLTIPRVSGEGLPASYIAMFPQSSFITPFNACGGKAQQISHDYILPIQQFIIYIGFAFLVAKMLLGLFNLGGTGSKGLEETK